MGNCVSIADLEIFDGNTQPIKPSAPLSIVSKERFYMLFTKADIARQQYLTDKMNELTKDKVFSIQLQMVHNVNRLYSLTQMISYLEESICCICSVINVVDPVLDYSKLYYTASNIFVENVYECHMIPEWQQYEFCKMAYNKNKYISKYINKLFLNKILVEETPALFEHIPAEEQTEHLRMVAVEKDPMNLKFVVHKTDNVIELAIKKNGRVIEFVEDPSKIMQYIAINQNPSAFNLIKKKTLEVYIYVLKICNDRGLDIPHVTAKDFYLEETEENKMHNKMIDKEFDKVIKDTNIFLLEGKPKIIEKKDYYKQKFNYNELLDALKISNGMAFLDFPETLWCFPFAQIALHYSKQNSKIMMFVIKNYKIILSTRNGTTLEHLLTPIKVESYLKGGTCYQGWYDWVTNKQKSR